MPCDDSEESKAPARVGDNEAAIALWRYEMRSSTRG